MMLILTRRIGEAVVIGEDIFITVLGIKGSRARLGIDAPLSMPVQCNETWFRRQEEKAVFTEGSDEEIDPDNELTRVATTCIKRQETIIQTTH